MLFGELPELDETVAGKELIRIGEQRGKKLGMERAILAFLAARHGTVPQAIQEKVTKLTPADLERMAHFLAECQSLDEVSQWLARPKAQDLEGYRTTTDPSGYAPPAQPQGQRPPR
jgi:hypothetical protein